MKKTERILTALIAWPYIGGLAGFIFAALFGGRGGMLFVALGLVGGCVVGVIRTVFILFTKTDSNHNASFSLKRLIITRVIVGILYVFSFTILIESLVQK